MKKVCLFAIVMSLLWVACSYEYPSFRNEYGTYIPGGFLSTIIVAELTRLKKAQQNEQVWPIACTINNEPYCPLLSPAARSESLPLNIQYSSIHGTINPYQVEFQKKTAFQGITVSQKENPWEYIDAAQEAALIEKCTEIFLKKCTVEQFKQYVAKCGVETTQQLVAHLKWWPYDVFWKHVESLPDGHDELYLFKRSYLNDNEFFLARWGHFCTGQYRLGDRDLVKKQYLRHEERHKRKEQEAEWQRQCAQQRYAAEQEQKAEIEWECQYVDQQMQAEQLQKAQQAIEQAQRVQRKTIEDHYHADRCTMAELVNEWQESGDQRLQERAFAWNQNNVVFQEHTFTINQVQQKFLKKHQLNSDQWGMIYGSMLQKKLHTELLACIDDAISLHDDLLFVQTVDLAHQTNRAGFVASSSLLVDLCIAVVKGTVGGSAQGVCNAVYTKLRPIDSTINTIKALSSIAQKCAQVGSTAVQLAYYYATDEQKYCTTMRDICDYNAAVCEIISDYFSTHDVPHIAYDASYLIAKTVVSGRSMRLISGWGSKLTQKLANYAKQCAAESQLVVIGLPGLKIDGAQFFEKNKCNPKGGSYGSSNAARGQSNTHNIKGKEANKKDKSGGAKGRSVAKDVANQSNKVLKAKSGRDFLDNTEFGQWLNNYCEGTSRHYKGEQVYIVTGAISHPYLKEGDIFYLDSLHKDHLEVFRKFDGKFRQKHVFNLDGTRNGILADKAIAKGRIYRW